VRNLLEDTVGSSHAKLFHFDRAPLDSFAQKVLQSEPFHADQNLKIRSGFPIWTWLFAASWNSKGFQPFRNT
jgi:hypothetical protein